MRCNFAQPAVSAAHRATKTHLFKVPEFYHLRIQSSLAYISHDRKLIELEILAATQVVTFRNIETRTAIAKTRWSELQGALREVTNAH